MFITSLFFVTLPNTIETPLTGALECKFTVNIPEEYQKI